MEKRERYQTMARTRYKAIIQLQKEKIPGRMRKMKRNLPRVLNKRRGKRNPPRVPNKK